MNKIILDNKDASPSEEKPIDEMVLDFLADRGVTPSRFKWSLVIEYEERESIDEYLGIKGWESVK